jgi:hypothetical protein
MHNSRGWWCVGAPCVVPVQIEAVLAAKRTAGQAASITSFPKQAHGFALRGDSTDAMVAQAASTAFSEGVKLLDKHLA